MGIVDSGFGHQFLIAIRLNIMMNRYRNGAMICAMSF